MHTYCLAFAFILHAAATPAPTADLRPLIAHHAQWWEEMGVDKAAHALGVEPMPLRIGTERQAHLKRLRALKARKSIRRNRRCGLQS